MKKVLIVTPTFPPQSNVGGLRAAMFSKYLPKFGWDPIILTGMSPEADSDSKSMMKIEGVPSQEKTFRVSWANYTPNASQTLMNNFIFKKIKSFFMPDYFQPYGFVEAMIHEGEKVLRNNKVDMIYATSPYFGCLTVADHLSRKFDIPWVADFRDVVEKATTIREKLLHIRLYFRRKYIIRTASAVITVSEHHADILKSHLAKKNYVVANGYDSELFTEKREHQSNKFTITYMGRILNEWLQNPRPLFAAIDILLLDHEVDPKDIELSFYGTDKDLINKIANDYECKRNLRVMERVDYVLVPNIIQESCVNLILTNKGRLGVLGSKTFEYLAVKRPILSIPDDRGELSELIKKTNSGAVCNDAIEIAGVLRQWYFEWKESGTVICKSDTTEIAKYSREQQTGELATILKDSFI